MGFHLIFRFTRVSREDLLIFLIEGAYWWCVIVMDFQLSRRYKCFMNRVEQVRCDLILVRDWGCANYLIWDIPLLYILPERR